VNLVTGESRKVRDAATLQFGIGDLEPHLNGFGSIRLSIKDALEILAADRSASDDADAQILIWPGPIDVFRQVVDEGGAHGTLILPLSKHGMRSDEKEKRAGDNEIRQGPTMSHHADMAIVDHLASAFR
jgi:hypothetical protein